MQHASRKIIAKDQRSSWSCRESVGLSVCKQGDGKQVNQSQDIRQVVIYQVAWIFGTAVALTLSIPSSTTMILVMKNTILEIVVDHTHQSSFKISTRSSIEQK